MAPALKRLIRNHAFRRVRTRETSMKTLHLSRVCDDHILAEPLHEQSICLEAGAQSRAAQPSCRDAKHLGRGCQRVRRSSG